MPSAPETSLPLRATPRHREGPQPLRRRRAEPPSPWPLWRRTAHFLVVFVTIVLLVDALVGEKGLMDTIRARREAQELTTSLERLREENARLRAEARRLREDAATIESLARKELGLMRPGEVLFILKDAKPASAR